MHALYGFARAADDILDEFDGRGPQQRLGNTRVHRPWITEPGLWLQYDFGDGPAVAGRKVVLLVAWLAWCRFRIVIALHDRTAPSVFAGLDRIFRIIGGIPTALSR